MCMSHLVEADVYKARVEVGSRLMGISNWWKNLQPSLDRLVLHCARMREKLTDCSIPLKADDA